MLGKVWGFRSGVYEECRLLEYKKPVRTSQETHDISATESNRFVLCKIWGFHGAVTMKNSAFWDVTPYDICKNGRFGEAYNHFHPEDGGSIFLRNVGSYKSHAASRPRRRHSSITEQVMGKRSCDCNRFLFRKFMFFERRKCKTVEWYARRVVLFVVPIKCILRTESKLSLVLLQMDAPRIARCWPQEAVEAVIQKSWMDDLVIRKKIILKWFWGCQKYSVGWGLGPVLISYGHCNVYSMS
jgi:hypothetical protein